MRIVSALAAVVLLAGCQQSDEVSADHGWVRLPGAAGRPGAVYFTIHGGAKATTLVSVSAPFAVRAEMHETMPDMSMPMPAGMDHATMMAPAKDVSVPARSEVAFAPGGKHVMLYDIAPRVQSGDVEPVTLTFADGMKVEIQAKVVGAGDPEPK